MKKIGVVGVGGRTGTMFAFELKRQAQVFGIARRSKIDLIRNRRLFVEREGAKELFESEMIEDTNFPNGTSFDFLFLTVRNPIGPVVRYYYQQIAERRLTPPVLLLSQNGLDADDDAISVLREIFGKGAENIRVIRISLFNPVDKKVSDAETCIVYSLPVRIAIAKIFGSGDIKDVIEIFRKSGFDVTPVREENAKNMEYSKLLLNLIGMPSATRGLSIKEGFSEKEVFREEVLAIREYIRAVKNNGGSFINFPHYPIKLFSMIVSLPMGLLFALRTIFVKLIEKKRMGKEKELSEINYYNGAVIRLGKVSDTPTPVNEKILERVRQ